MSDLENRLNEKIKSLEEVLEKYNELNKKTKYRYNWRIQGIQNQIEVLEDLRDGKNINDWLECYEEDLRESERG